MQIHIMKSEGLRPLTTVTVRMSVLSTVMAILIVGAYVSPFLGP